ncbi:hypothetical protein ACFQ1M_05660 [Sungkyunkwania multivorans]|uniref:Uncharacterized protein n=1 Tax=Sungkyunkwania multivorans TaxID=1173618 RepID=A0ABW3CVK6_9FLAO
MKPLNAYRIVILLLTVGMFSLSCQKENLEDEVVVQQELVTDFEEAEALFEEYLMNNDGIIAKGDDPGKSLGIDSEVYDELKASYDEVNRQIEAGEIKREWIGQSIDLETKEIITLSDRACNRNKISFGWTTATVYLSTNSASWASVVGCSAVGLAGFWPGVACAAIIQALNQFVCTCGYKSKVTYWGSVKWTRCQ